MPTAIPSQKSHRLRPPRDFRAEAAAMGLDVAGLDDSAVRTIVGKEQADRFRSENREWIEAHNAWVEANGLPLEKYRMF